jgi:hypothetical protein
MSAIGQINALNKVLVCKQFKESENGSSADAKVSLLCIGEKIRSGEVPVTPCDQGGKLSARPGEADPRLIKRLEQLLCHRGILSELRLSLNTWRPRPNGGQLLSRV